MIQGSRIPAFQVENFREKPDRVTAEQYVAAGNYYWNSGIFLWRASTILDALKKNVPEMHSHLEKIAEAMDTDHFNDTLEKEFTAIDGTSIDYAVMENYPNVVAVEAPFPWDDVGSWQALSRLHEPDEQGNTVVGSHLGIDTKGAIIHAQPGHTIVTIDVDDLIVVQTGDATLVAPKHAEELSLAVDVWIAWTTMGGTLVANNADHHRRGSRMGMVQTLGQYTFCYEALVADLEARAA